MTITSSKPQTWQQIACLNWPDTFPYAPDVKFRMWHAGHDLHIEFFVTEKTTKAEQNVPGGEVYMDSCVECFIQPDPSDPHYYNFEWNAAGHLALGYRTGRSDAEHAPLEVIGSVRAVPSLGSDPFPECSVGQWVLEVAIPLSALYRHFPASGASVAASVAGASAASGASSAAGASAAASDASGAGDASGASAEPVDVWAGRTMRMNLYKCGDGLAEPHYLTWQPISTPAPDYHRPEFCVPVTFE